MSYEKDIPFDVHGDVEQAKAREHELVKENRRLRAALDVIATSDQEHVRDAMWTICGLASVARNALKKAGR